jgi:hypothetical protein
MRLEESRCTSFWNLLLPNTSHFYTHATRNIGLVSQYLGIMVVFKCSASIYIKTPTAP